MYEENISTLTPVVADQLIDTAEEYGEKIVEEAIKQTAERGIRNWRYISKVIDSIAVGDSYKQESPDFF